MPVELDLNESQSIYEANPDSVYFARFAHTLYVNNEIERALEVCGKGIQQFPDYLTGRLVYAKCLHQSNKLDDAVAQYIKALGIEGRCLRALKELGEIYQSQGLLGEAIIMYSRLLEIDPLDSQVAGLLASLSNTTSSSKLDTNTLNESTEESELKLSSKDETIDDHIEPEPHEIQEVGESEIPLSVTQGELESALDPLLETEASQSPEIPDPNTLAWADSPESFDSAESELNFSEDSDSQEINPMNPVTSQDVGDALDDILDESGSDSDVDFFLEEEPPSFLEADDSSTPSFSLNPNDLTPEDVEDAFDSLLGDSSVSESPNDDFNDSDSITGEDIEGAMDTVLFEGHQGPIPISDSDLLDPTTELSSESEPQSGQSDSRNDSPPDLDSDSAPYVESTSFDLEDSQEEKNVPPLPLEKDLFTMRQVPKHPTSENVATVTLAEIYYNQGLKEQALEIYRQLLDREKDNKEIINRIEEIKNSQTQDPGPPSVSRDSDRRIMPRPGVKIKRRRR